MTNENKSAIERAIELIEQGVTRHAAAKQVGLAPSVVYAALRRRRLAQAGCCPHCGQAWDGVKRG